jgi:hypothetical protein
VTDQPTDPPDDGQSPPQGEDLSKLFRGQPEPPKDHVSPEQFQEIVKTAANVIDMAKAVQDRLDRDAEEKKRRRRERADRKRDGASLPGAVVKQPTEPPADPPGRGRGADDERRGSCPLVFLGAREGVYFIASPRGELRAMKFQHLRAQGLVSLFDGNLGWAYEHFPAEVSEDGRKSGLSEKALASWIMRECSRQGFLDQRDVRGGGVWLEADGGLVVHTGDDVLLIAAGGKVERAGVGWRSATALYTLSDRQTQPRLEGEGEALRLAPVGPGIGAALEAHLASWAWKEPADGRLWLGWHAQAMLAGALDWSPHIIVTGDSNAGKSALQRLSTGLLGRSLVGPLADPTEAGLRFMLRGGARPVVVDEMENSVDNRKVEAVMDLATLASTRDQGFKLRGAEGGTTVLYPVRGTFYLQAILHPPLSPANATRFAVLGMQRPPADPDVAARLGERQAFFASQAAGLRSRMIAGFARFRENLAVYIRVLMGMGHRARFADQYGTLLAAADTMCCDHVTDEAAARHFVDMLPPPVAADAFDESADHWQCWNRLVSSTIERQTQTPIGTPIRERLSIGEALQRAVRKNGDPTTAHHALRRTGIGVEMHKAFDQTLPWIVVANRHSQLEAIFQGTRWSGGVWAQALGRLPGACRLDKVPNFAGAKSRATWLPPDLLPQPDDVSSGDAASPAPPSAVSEDLS